MKIMVTGTEGYLGALLAPMLMERGHDVIGLDTGFYKVGWLYNDGKSTPRILNKDTRLISEADLEEVDAVVHLAELSNDPAGQLCTDATYDINHHGSVRLATIARLAGVQRFVYSSSCSVYGVATGGHVHEASEVNPQTAYAKCKTLVERDLKRLASDDFSPTILRNATAFGASPRMRFDIVLNNLAGWAWTTREIKMQSDGTPWRPLVHALDICQAIICVLDAPRQLVHDEIFNVGDSAHNYRVKEIAEAVADVFPDCRLSFGSNGEDNRSYRVDFEKINATLPGFKCKWTAEEGARQLRDIFSRIDMSGEAFEFRGFTRLKQLEYLVRTNQINNEFFWTRTHENETESLPVRRQAA